jgi:uncharacterized protein (TIGR02145 family)
MKKIFALFIGIILSILILSSQVAPPKYFSYKAVITKANGQPLASTTIRLRISILQNSINGTAVYIETSTPKTSKDGQIDVKIGDGIAQLGIFADIDWSTAEFFLKTEFAIATLDPYKLISVTQLLSVPYALYAGSAKETDPVFTASPAYGITNVDIANWNTTTWSEISDKPTTVAGFGITDAVTTSGYQLIEGTKVFLDSINANLQTIVNVGEPINPQDAATKAYVDALMDQLFEQGILRLKDVDGNFYETVKLGTQVWMGENLKTSRYNDGTVIPLITGDTAWARLSTPGRCWYNNDSSTYGALYNWYVVDVANNGHKNVCPTGWHVPSSAEMMALGDYLIANGFNYDGTTTYNRVAKSLAATTNWSSSTVEGAPGNTDYPAYRNKTGISCLPGGWRSIYGSYEFLGYTGYWWSASEAFPGAAEMFSLAYNYNYSIGSNENEKIGGSIRCLRDTSAH